MKKWRNKITGEISEFMVHKRIEDSEDGNPVYAPFNGHIKEWEDYEEKEYWWSIMVNFNYEENRSEVSIVRLDKKLYDPTEAIEIGFYFKTKEEAEKAVEKLKAWKRLKDKGFKFKTYMRNPQGTYDCFAIWEDNIPPASIDIAKDLNLLFGGEE